MFKLRRLSSEPILEPIAEHPFERAAMFNCAVVMHGRKIHMIYQTADRDFVALFTARTPGRAEVCLKLRICRQRGRHHFSTRFTA